MSKKYSCGPDNIDAFKNKLRKVAPSIFPLVNALYRAGLIDGLRAVKIETGLDIRGVMENGAAGKKQASNCLNCKHWTSTHNGGRRGRCGKKHPAINIRWGDVPACSQWEGKTQ